MIWGHSLWALSSANESYQSGRPSLSYGNFGYLSFLLIWFDILELCLFWEGFCFSKTLSSYIYPLYYFSSIYIFTFACILNLFLFSSLGFCPCPFSNLSSRNNYLIPLDFGLLTKQSNILKLPLNVALTVPL